MQSLAHTPEGPVSFAERLCDLPGGLHPEIDGLSGLTTAQFLGIGLHRILLPPSRGTAPRDPAQHLLAPTTMVCIIAALTWVAAS